MASNKLNSSTCLRPVFLSSHGALGGDHIFEYTFPLFIFQTMLIVITSRFLGFILKPLRQSRFTTDLLAGVLWGPTIANWLEKSNHELLQHLAKKMTENIFPHRSKVVLDTMANIGLLYFLFILGLEMDLRVIKKTGKKGLIFALAGMVLPFIISSIFAHFSDGVKDNPTQRNRLIVFMGISLSVTAFPVLARILADLKLLNTEFGRIAMSSSVFNEMCAWILLAFAIAWGGTAKPTLISMFYLILLDAIFLLFCIYVVRPGIAWMIRRTPEGENYSEFFICVMLTGVLICGLITDAIGTHAMFGAFVFGLIIPNGPLGAMLIEKLEDFVTGLMLPLIFALIGQRLDLTIIKWKDLGTKILPIIVFGTAGKVVGTLLVALFYKIPFQEGLVLGFLMNTKGLIEIIVLNAGYHRKVVDNKTFAALVIVVTVMSGITMPIITMVYKRGKRFIPYKRRTIQTSTKLDTELGILACIHNPRNAPTIINLLEASHPTKNSPICVYTLHLVELTGRTSSMLIVHNTHKSGSPALNRTQANSDHIINAFENYEKQTSNVSVQPFTAISPYSTMHEDICNLAEDKCVSFIIIPFHKQKTVDGGMEATNAVYRKMNQNVLANAPCSVGILIDRGFSGSSTRDSVNQIYHHIVVLFFGGPDDREALAYACRMAEHPGINLTILRFLPGEDARDPMIQPSSSSDPEQGILTIIIDNDNERQLDDEFIREIKMKTMNSVDSIIYIEKVVNNGEETVTAIRAIDVIHDLYIVGRGQGVISPLMAGLTEWSECPELGPIGDMLASSDFTAGVSVLVMQQYVGVRPQGRDSLGSTQQNDQYNNIDNFNWRPPRGSSQI